MYRIQFNQCRRHLFTSFLMVIGLGIFSQSFSAQFQPTNPKLLILGDSLSAAYGMDMTKGWASLLQTQLDHHNQEITVVNTSISGETTSGGKNRLPTLLKQHQPSWVILELGANDALRGQQLNSTRSNLNNMIDMSHQIGAKVLLLGIRLPTNYGPAYDAALQNVYQQLSNQHQLLFDPFFLETVALDPNLMQADGLHPNEKAQPLILKRLWPNIQKLLAKD